MKRFNFKFLADSTSFKLHNNNLLRMGLLIGFFFHFSLTILIPAQSLFKNSETGILAGNASRIDLMPVAVAAARTRLVPTEFSTIQAAINAAAEADTVLVAPGTYFENINFLGKNIVVASHYILAHNPEHIINTVINGSQPVHPDTASCVMIVSGEDSTAVLEGFTLTGGVGTVWLDTHLNQNYREAGGILIELASPTIQHNLIINNVAINNEGVVSAGGGGIRCGDGNPKIIANVIMNNEGLYGGGIVMNFSTGVIKNNIICHNTGGEDYGGSGVWTYAAGETILENNTIVDNISRRRGGGIQVWDTSIRARNNIVWGNQATQGGPQIAVVGSGSIDISFSAIEGGWDGEGNIEQDPLFLSADYLLSSNSPAVDAGDSTAAKDPEDPRQPGQAAFPSRGGLRPDMGAYGGRLRTLFATFYAPQIMLSDSILVFKPIEPGQADTVKFLIENTGNNQAVVEELKIEGDAATEMEIKIRTPLKLLPQKGRSVMIIWSPTSNYQSFCDTLLIFHNDVNAPNPLKILLQAEAPTKINLHHPESRPWTFELAQNFPNPFNLQTTIQYTLPEPAHVTLTIFNITGQEVQVLLDQDQSSGVHRLKWDTRHNNQASLVSGLYYFQMIAQTEGEIFVAEKKMLLLK